MKIFKLMLAAFFLLNISTAAAQKDYEIQMEYLSGKSFSSRNVNNYNVHIFRKAKDNGTFSISYGATFTRAVGATNPRQEGIWKDSNGVGIGPAGLLR